MGSRRRELSVGFAALAICMLFMAIGETPSGVVPAGANGSPWGESYLPNVQVLDQDGGSKRFYDEVLKGKTTVVSFIYTSCRSICPLTLARLREVQEMLGDAVGRDIFFVSISIDPIPDTPEKLKDYAAAFKVAPGWSFLTGKPVDIDLIRYKLGERSGSAISLHKNEVLMYNDTTGQWSRDSAFTDLGVLAENIRMMDPGYRDVLRPTANSEVAANYSAATDTPGQALFIKACASCHTVGRGDKVGPDLAGLSQRRSDDWVRAYLTGPQKMRNSGDPIAVELERRFPVVRMPELGLSPADVEDLVSFISKRAVRSSAAETALTK